MLPMALGLDEGGEQRAPMAHAVIGGLISSTALNLVLVPVVLTYLDGMAGAWGAGLLIRRLPQGREVGNKTRSAAKVSQRSRCMTS
jgi:hypothetical protein